MGKQAAATPRCARGRVLPALLLAVVVALGGAALPDAGPLAACGGDAAGAVAWAAPAKSAQEEAPYWVDVTYQGDGTVEASARVEPGDSHTVHWKADPGAEVLSVTVDGQDRPDLVGDGSAGHVDFAGIDADHSVAVRFSAANAPADGTFFVIDTAIEGGPGWITGAGLVPRGGSRVVTWEADEGWQVAAVVVDGQARTDLMGVGSTIFQRLSGDHTVTVVVAPDESAAAAGSDSSGDDREATLFAQRKAASPTSPFAEPADGAPRLVYDLVAAVHAGGMASLVVGVVLFAALVSGAHVLSDRRRYYEEDRQEAAEAAAAEQAERQAEADAYLAGYYDAYLAAYGDDADDGAGEAEIIDVEDVGGDGAGNGSSSSLR